MQHTPNMGCAGGGLVIRAAERMHTPESRLLVASSQRVALGECTLRCTGCSVRLHAQPRSCDFPTRPSARLNLLAHLLAVSCSPTHPPARRQPSLHFGISPPARNVLRSARPSLLLSFLSPIRPPSPTSTELRSVPSVATSLPRTSVESVSMCLQGAGPRQVRGRGGRSEAPRFVRCRQAAGWGGFPSSVEQAWSR